MKPVVKQSLSIGRQGIVGTLEKISFCYHHFSFKQFPRCVKEEQFHCTYQASSVLQKRKKSNFMITVSRHLNLTVTLNFIYSDLFCILLYMFSFLIIFHLRY